MKPAELLAIRCILWADSFETLMDPLALYDLGHDLGSEAQDLAIDYAQGKRIPKGARVYEERCLSCGQPTGLTGAEWVLACERDGCDPFLGQAKLYRLAHFLGIGDRPGPESRFLHQILYQVYHNRRATL